MLSAGRDTSRPARSSRTSSVASTSPRRFFHGRDQAAGALAGTRRFRAEKRTRKYIIAARDRCDGTVDRIRCVRSERYKYIRNYYPDQPYTQFNAYKKLQYPALTVMQVLHKQGKLTADQAGFMAANRPGGAI